MILYNTYLLTYLLSYLLTYLLTHLLAYVIHVTFVLNRNQRLRLRVITAH